MITSDTRALTSYELHDVLIKTVMARNHDLRFNDRCIIYFLALVGARPRELSLLRIRDCVNPDGTIKQFTIVSEGTWNGKARPLMLTDDYITLSLHEHFDWQLKKGINLHSTHKYGGLNPNAFLFYNSSHKPFTLQKRGAGKLIPAALNKHIDEILKMTGLWSVGVKRPCFISTFINNAYKSNMSVTDIMLSSGLGEAAIQNHLILDYKQENPITNWYMSKKQNIESCTENFLERLMRIDEFRK